MLVCVFVCVYIYISSLVLLFPRHDHLCDDLLTSAARILLCMLEVLFGHWSGVPEFMQIQMLWQNVR